MKRLLAMLGTFVALTGCATHDGSGVVSGSSTTRDVEAVMGVPAMRVAQPDGGSVLYYPSGPLGRQSYAITVGANGVVRSVEQRLTLANYNRLRVGTTTAKEVAELFGPADRSTMSYLPLQKRDVWEYKWLDYQEKRIFWFQFSDDGILRETLNSRDDFHESPGAAMP